MSDRIQVQMPDGTVIDAPSTVTKAELQAKYSAAQATPGFFEDLLDKAKLYGSAAVRGALTTPALAAEAGMAEPRAFNRKPGQDNSGKAMSDVAAIGTHPTTTGEKYAVSAVEGLAGALAGPGAVVAPVKTAVTGIVSGLGAEGAGQATDQNPIARVLGALLGGGLTGIATSAKNTRSELVQETLRDAKPADLEAAKALMTDALGKGVPLNLSQAMPRASNIDAMVERLATSRHGQNVSHQLREQPRQVALGMEDETAKLPGAIRAPQDIANNAQEAAANSIRKGYEQAQAAWQKAAPQGSTIPEGAVASLDAQLKALAARFPNTSGAELINDARQALKAPGQAAPAGPAIVGPNGQPINPPPAASKYLTDALQLKGALEDALSTFGSRKLNTTGLDATNLRRAQEVREAFRDIVSIEAPQLSAANAAYSSVMEGVVNPTKKSVVGRVAQRIGDTDTTEAVKSKVFSVLDAGTIPGSTSSEILTLERGLRKTNPEAFQDAAKTWLANKLSKASTQEGGRIGENVAGNIERSLAGNEVQAQGFKDVLVGLARSKGMPDNTLLPGMERMMKIVGAAGRRPGNTQGVGPGELDDISRSRTLASAGAFNVLTPLRQFARKANDALNADSYSFMDKLLTSPEGVDMLRKLGRQQPISTAMLNTLNTLTATAATAEPDK
jgi:hypothetical protein